MGRKVTVTFTEAQARAVNASLAYADSGEPEEGGLHDHAMQRAASNARALLCAAMEGRGVAFIEPEPSAGPAHAYGEPSVQADIANHDLVLGWRKPLDSEYTVEARIPVEDVPGFLDRATREGMHVLMDAMTDIGYGDCKTCTNTRLVDVELPGGRQSNQNCPDCRGDRNLNAATVLKGAPTVGPKIRKTAQWVRTEGWVLPDE